MTTITLSPTSFFLGISTGILFVVLFWDLTPFWLKQSKNKWMQGIPRKKYWNKRVVIMIIPRYSEYAIKPMSLRQYHIADEYDPKVGFVKMEKDIDGNTKILQKFPINDETYYKYLY